MTHKFLWAIVVVVAGSLITAGICCRAPGVRVYNPKRPEPELLFPGVSKWSVTASAESSTETLQQIVKHVTTIGSAAGSAVPQLKIIGLISKCISVTFGLLGNAKEGLLDLVNKQLGKDAIQRAVVSMELIRDRLDEMKITNDRVLQDAKRELAWHESNKILKEFESDEGPLFRNSNALVASPSLVAFVGVYSGVASLILEREPNMRNVTMAGLEKLRKTLRMFRDAVVKKRTSYFSRIYAPFCLDLYFNLVPECKSCAPGCPDFEQTSYWPKLKTLYMIYFDVPSSKLKESIDNIRRSGKMSAPNL